MSRRSNWLALSVLVTVAQALTSPASADAPPATGAAPPSEILLAAPGEDDGSADPQGMMPSIEPSLAYDIEMDTDPAALTNFGEALDGHGTWEEDPTYGLVWVPDPEEVGSDFAPYATGGHWGLGEAGEWVWVSDYDWGWATFHYGRWARIGPRRWGWVSGLVYAPAWVEWRTGYYDDYYVGWAPMPPTWYWRSGRAVRLGFLPSVPFFFCASHHVFAPRVFSHLVPPARVGAVAVRTQPYVAATAVTGGHYPLASTRSPSLAAAHVPVSALPAQRAMPEARIMVFARPSTRSFQSNDGVGSSHATLFGNRNVAPPFSQARPALPSRIGARGYAADRSSHPSMYRGPSGYRMNQAYRSVPSYGSRVFTPPSGSMSHSFGQSFRGAPSFRSGGPSFHSGPTFRGGGGARHR